MTAAVAFVATLALSIAATGLARAYALRRQVLDIANERSMHTRPTPRGGGLGMMAAFAIAIGALAALGHLDPRLAAALAVSVLPIALVGWIDDQRGLPAKLRLLVHLGSVGLAIAVLGGAPPVRLGDLVLAREGWATVLWVVGIGWLINLVNFMDGIDGIAGVEGATVAGAVAVYVGGIGATGVGSAVLSAACLGFLAWNWPPAKVFMGDVGSGALGAALGVLALYGARQGVLDLSPWLILLAVFVVDATYTLGRRVAAGKSPTQPHRTHAYQRAAMRFGHLPVTVAVLILNVFALAPLARLAMMNTRMATVFVAAAWGTLSVGAVILRAGTDTDAKVSRP